MFLLYWRDFHMCNHKPVVVGVGKVDGEVMRDTGGGRFEEIVVARSIEIEFWSLHLNGKL
jgi:hypothetical protein